MVARYVIMEKFTRCLCPFFLSIVTLVLECYVSRNLLENAERALFRMNDSIETDHDEEILARGLFVLMRAYLSNAKKSGDLEIVEKCQYLYKEIVVNGKLQPKTRGKEK
jgi:hypothetical protein